MRIFGEINRGIRRVVAPIWNLRHRGNWARKPVVTSLYLLILILALGSGTYALFFASNSSLGNSVNLSDGLVGYWPLNGNANDQSGYGNNGTINGTVTPTTGPQGNPNSAMNFDGNSYISTGINGLPSGSAARSAFAWVDATSYPSASTWAMVDSYGTASATEASALSITPIGDISFNSQNNDFVSSLKLSLNSWHLIGYTISGTQVTIYYDGQSQTHTLSAALDTVSTVNIIGSWSTGSYHWSGSIAGLRIYNRALNPSEITALYDLGNTVNLQKGLVGYWKLNGNTNDSTPYGDNGTPTNVTYTTGPNGQPSGAASFTGSNSAVRVPDNAAYKPTSQVTLAAWVNSSTINSGTNEEKFVSTTETGGYTLYMTGSSGDSCAPENVGFSVYIAGFGYEVACYPRSNFSSNTWYHIVGSYDGNTVKLYVNGVLVSSNIYSGTIQESSSAIPICIGSEATGTTCGGQFMTGSISDVRIYNRAINPAEVKALYDEYQPQLNINDLSRGLVGEWKLNGNAKDSTPSANDGTATNVTYTTGPNGQPNTAASFNGTSYVSIPNSSRLNPAGSISVSAWINPSTEYYTGNIVSNYQGVYRYRLVNGTGQLQVLLDNGGNNETLMTTQSIPLNKWTLVTFTTSGSGTSIYINGVLSAQSASMSYFPSTTGPLYIGTFTFNSTYPNSIEYFRGSISDVRVYNRALSAAEASELYNSYGSQINLGGDGSSSSINLTKGLVGYWPFNGNAYDATPYSDNGTVSGATLTTDRFGRANSAYSLSASQNISAPSSNLPVSAVTVSAWVNINSFSSSSSWLNLVNHNWYVNGSWLLYANKNGQALFGVSSGSASGGSAGCNSGTLATGGWYNLTGVYDGSTVKLYVDGAACPNTANMNVALTNTGSFLIATNPPTGASYSIDNVRIYNRALSAGEVAALYNLPD